MTLWKWSKTAATNSTADATINWAEGQAPSSVNDSARAMMAAVAKWRDDISGLLVSAGSSTAYTLTTNQVFASLALMDGQMICFRPHATSGASPTLNVDTLGAKPIVKLTGVAINTAGLLVGQPYQLLYNNAGNEWRLMNYFGTI